MARKSVPSKTRESRKLQDYRAEHQRHILGEEVKPYQTNIARGQVVGFNYGDKERWVFIVHPEWHGKIHGLDIQHIPRRDLLPLFDVPQSIPPEQFYKTYIDKPWVKRWDCYRTYERDAVSNVSIIIYDTDRDPDEKDEPRLKNIPRNPVIPNEDILPNE